MLIETPNPAPTFLRKSGVSELVEPLLVEAEIVGQLVQNGDADLRLELRRVVERLDERQPEDADPVGKLAGPVAPFGERHPLVEAEESGSSGCSSSTVISTFRTASCSPSGSEATARRTCSSNLNRPDSGRPAPPGA